jgi:hypothetical protein
MNIHNLKAETVLLSKIYHFKCHFEMFARHLGSNLVGVMSELNFLTLTKVQQDIPSKDTMLLHLKIQRFHVS